MDGVIKINGVEYDPYYVLDSTQEDSDEHINKMFRKKVRVVHPDKIKNASDEKIKKYELYMQILMESYEWIKRRREAIKKRRNGISNEKIEYKHLNEEELNKLFNKAEIKDDTKRFKSVEDYESFSENIINIFKNKKFTNDEFNDIFEYYKDKKQSKENSSIGTIKSNDGFYCNDSGINCAAVSSYNGLLISSDMALGEGNILEKSVSNNYYKTVYDLPNNPNEIPTKIKREKKTKFEEKLTDDIINKKLSEHNNDIRNVHRYTNYVDEREKLHNVIYQDLFEKEQYDKEVIEKYGKTIYNENLVEQAKAGELECSPTFISKLKEHHKMLRND